MIRPAFTHPVFEQLYERDYFIDDAVLRDILALGPEVAVPELLKITAATLDAPSPEAVEHNWHANFHFLHALYLLHDLHAPEALDVYRRLLRLDSETTDYWFGDYLFEEVPALLARAAQTRLPELLAMLEDNKMLLQHRLVVAGALARLVRERPALRPAIIEAWQRYLRYIIDHADKARLLFPADADEFGYDLDTYLGMMLTDIQEADLRELEPEVRELHRLGLVDESIAGGAADINFEKDRSLWPDPADIFSRYQQLRDIPDNYSPFHPDAANLARKRAEEEARLARLRAEHYARQQPRQVLPKIGRNDPCPCGSGKKYKKCCGA